MRELENGVNVNNTNKGNGRVGQVREGGSEDSERNGGVRKMVERSFGEKRV